MVIPDQQSVNGNWSKEISHPISFLVHHNTLVILVTCILFLVVKECINIENMISTPMYPDKSSAYTNLTNRAIKRVTVAMVEII